MIKKNFKKLLEFYNNKRDFTTSLQVQNGILSCLTYIPEGNESFFFQEAVEHPDFKAISVDFKEFSKFIDEKIKAKYPFHFHLAEDENTLQIFEEHDDSSKLIKELNYTPGGAVEIHSPADSSAILKSDINGTQFENLQLHDSIRTNIELYPDFAGITCYLHKAKLFFLSTDIASILATEISLLKQPQVDEHYFQISASSLKNMKAFVDTCTCKIFKLKEQQTMMEISKRYPGGNTELLMVYQISGPQLSQSFYGETKLHEVLARLSNSTYEPMLQVTKEDIKLLKEACTACRNESTWNDRRSVIFHLNQGIYLHEKKLLDFSYDKVCCRIPGYHFTALLNTPIVHKLGKRKEEIYELNHGEINGLAVFKNQNIYLIN